MKKAGIAALGVAIIVSAFALRSRPPLDPPARRAPAEPVPSAPLPISPPAPEPPARSEGGDPGREARGIAEALVGDEARRRRFLDAFVDMTRRLREIEKARVRCVTERGRTVIEVPAFREEGRAIHAEWLRSCLAILSPEEGARFTLSPDFESGRVSPELDLLRAANVFFGSRHGKDLTPDLSWEQTRRIDAQRLDDGTVQIRLGSPEHSAFVQFPSQQEALNYLTREYGHLLGPVPQLFR
jgi:hypothetical protein